MLETIKAWLYARIEGAVAAVTAYLASEFGLIGKLWGLVF